MSAHVKPTPGGLRQYDDRPALDAVLAAWTRPGRSLRYHRAMQAEARAAMPVLARALDRLEREAQQNENQQGEK